MSATDRWPAILLQLHAEGWQRAIDLATALGVSVRTIYRDMQALDEAGLPIEAVPGKGYRLNEDYLLDPIVLSTDEAVLLLLGGTYVARHAEGLHRAAATAAQRKLERMLSEDQREKMAALRARVRLVPVSVFGHTPDDQRLHTLRRALMERRSIQFREGPSADEAPTERTMNPYGLMRRGATWYLIGWAHDLQRVLHVRLDHMHDLQRLDETFERPTGYRSELDTGDALPDQTVRVLFAPAVASSVQAPPSLHVEHTEHRPDGRLLMTLHVYHEQEVLPWLLSWGAHAHVLEPSSLRQRLAREARRIAEQYQEAPRLIE